MVWIVSRHETTAHDCLARGADLPSRGARDRSLACGYFSELPSVIRTAENSERFK
jgi:hypothetical protein